MVKIADYRKIGECIDKMAFMEHYKELNRSGDRMWLPSFTFLDGYTLIFSTIEKKKVFNTNYIFKVDTKRMIDILDGAKICTFKEFAEELKKSEYKIKGLNDNYNRVEEIANYEIINTISEEHRERMMLFGLENYIDIKRRSDINGYSIYYEKTVLFAREIVKVMEADSREDILKKLIKEMSLNYIMYLSTLSFCDKDMALRILETINVSEDILLEKNMARLSIKNLRAAIDNDRR